MKNLINSTNSKNGMMRFIMILLFSVSQITCASNINNESREITVAEKNGIAVKIINTSVDASTTDEVSNFFSERGMLLLNQRISQQIYIPV